MRVARQCGKLAELLPETGFETGQRPCSCAVVNAGFDQKIIRFCLGKHKLCICRGDFIAGIMEGKTLMNPRARNHGNAGKPAIFERGAGKRPFQIGWQCIKQSINCLRRDFKGITAAAKTQKTRVVGRFADNHLRFAQNFPCAAGRRIFLRQVRPAFEAFFSWRAIDRASSNLCV